MNIRRLIEITLLLLGLAPLAQAGNVRVLDLTAGGPCTIPTTCSMLRIPSGLQVYGLSRSSSAVITNYLNVGSMTVVGGGGASITYGLSAGSAAIAGLATAGSLTVTGAARFSVSFSTKAAAGAGVANTVTCPAGTYVLAGGCTCTGAVDLTAAVGNFTPLTAGAMPTGWTCQAPGGTGGQCVAAATCSRIQF